MSTLAGQRRIISVEQGNKNIDYLGLFLLTKRLADKQDCFRELEEELPAIWR